MHAGADRAAAGAEPVGFYDRVLVEHGETRGRATQTSFVRARAQVGRAASRKVNVHFVGRSHASTAGTPALYRAHSRDYRQSALVDGQTTGSVHTHLSLNALDAGGLIHTHMHAFEEGFYVLEGEAIFHLDAESFHLRRGDYGVVKTGALHGWRAAGSAGVRWLQLASPHPKPAGAERDTFFARERILPADAPGVGEGPARSFVGHFDVEQIPAPGAARSGLSALPGVFLQWLIDEAFGARHHRLLLIEYQPGVGIGLHDHAFEEAYYILSGEVQATLDGQTYVAGPGDVIWTGVGCVHAFSNVSSEPVRWLETFAPQPPQENVFRFFAEWEEKGVALSS